MLDRGLDQAAGLRAMMPPPSLSVFAFPLAASGGAQPWVAQVAHALRALDRRPLVLDAARGTVSAGFGMKLRYELLDLLQGEREFSEVAQATSDGIHVLRADRGIEAFVGSGKPASALIGSFSRLSHGFDDLLLAMPAEEIACLAGPRDCAPVIALTPGPNGMVQAYSMVKLLAERFGYGRFTCVVHGAQDDAQAHGDHERLATAAARFLQVQVVLAGSLPAGRQEHAPRLRRIAQALLDTAGAPQVACAA